ncbi:hypothetical protein ACO0LB_17855 [Undibacterium sp. SXout7W]|uniref:hypothetical protein n=1 Tax=Undibacterium sp. SXout7W TaxID=3413049 RepID=UPI003BF0F184
MTSSIARVFINHVEVGSVPLDTYRDLVAGSWKTPRLYLAQMLNLLYVIIKFGIGFVTALPVLVFGCVGAAAWLAPDELQKSFTFLQTCTAAELVLLIQHIGSPLFVIYIMIQGFRGTVSNTSFGFINQFSAYTNRQLRLMLEMPVEGDVIVIEGKIE